jgi:hypothetical protein
VLKYFIISDKEEIKRLNVEGGCQLNRLGVHKKVHGYQSINVRQEFQTPNSLERAPRDIFNKLTYIKEMIVPVYYRCIALVKVLVIGKK